MTAFHLVPHGEPLPRDREIYIATDEGDVRQVEYCNETRRYTGRDCWRRTDGESGGWEADEIFGWSDSFEAAEVQAAVVGAAQ